MAKPIKRTKPLKKLRGEDIMNGEQAFHCPFCNHHKKKLQVNTETQKWHCWVCNKGGYKIGILLRKINAPNYLINMPQFHYPLKT